MASQRDLFDYKGYSYQVMTQDNGDTDVVLISTENRAAFLKSNDVPTFPYMMMAVDLMDEHLPPELRH